MARDTPELTPDQRALLAALARGGRDEIVARRLGVSTRTFRRRLAELMRQLGATSRFQAGAKAAHARLLPPNDEQPSEWGGISRFGDGLFTSGD